MLIRCSIACLACISVAGIARAEISVGESIEWIVADSDRVVVGKIKMVQPAGEHEIVTIEVAKTLRGKHEGTIQCTLRSSKVGGLWQKAGGPILFCLVNRDRLKQDEGLPEVGLVLRFGTNQSSAFLLGKADPPSPDVFTRDFAVLTDSNVILKHVEAYSKTIPVDWKRKSIKVKPSANSPAFRKLWAGSSVYFTLPVDPALEVQGRKCCRSDRGDDRVRGIICLKEFPNEGNIKILKGLLTDENIATGSGKNYFYVRTRAFETLRDLGVRVERPILEESAK